MQKMQQLELKPFFLAILIIPCLVGATDYFVDSEAGNDAASGTCPEAAWKTLARTALNGDVKPGDTVRLKRGSLWRESLRPVSGEPGHPVTYTWYGVGPKPIIQRSASRSHIEDWEPVGDGLWATKRCPPTVKEQIWDGMCVPEPWDCSFQGGCRGSVKTMEENGRRFVRVKLDKKAYPNKRSHLQLWGPKIPNLPTSAVMRLKVRSSKPFRLVTLRLARDVWPWTAALAGHVKRAVPEIGRDWSDLEVLLEGPGSQDGSRPHFPIGDVMPEGAVFDFIPTGIWRREFDASAALPYDVGIFICNHGEKWGVKKWHNPDWEVPQTPTWRRSVQMENDLDYYYDPDDMRVVVKYPRNPAAAFKSIELALTKSAVNEVDRHDVVYDGLCVRYTAAHGFSGGNTANITIRNCDIYWIGGGLQKWKRHEKTGEILYPVRYGNGIEFWGTCTNNVVERNRLWEVYDAALTNQGGDDMETDIVWRDNVIWNAENSYEYWNAKLTRNVQFVHNTCVDAGYGWAHAQRPNPNGAHLLSYQNRAATTNFVVRDNLFVRATEWTARSGLDWRYGLTHDHNVVWNEGNVPVMRWLEHRACRLLSWDAYRELGFDPHGTFARPTFVNERQRDYRLAPESVGKGAASDGSDVGARDMPGLDIDQSTSGSRSAGLAGWQ